MHSSLRHTMRVNPQGKLDKHTVENGYRINLDDYGPSIWNLDKGIIFLLSGETVCTCIPADDVEPDPDNLEMCGSCEALWPMDSDVNHCQFCNSKKPVVEEKVSLPTNNKKYEVEN